MAIGIPKIVATDHRGIRAVYVVTPGPKGLFLDFDPSSMPAYATRDAPVPLDVDGRRYLVYVSVPTRGAPVWAIEDGSGQYLLSRQEADVATTNRDLEAMVREWRMHRSPRGGEGGP